MTFERATWLKAVLPIAIFVVYGGAFGYIFSKRNYAETKARSPKTTMLCTVFLMLDSLCNTWIFAINTRTSDTDVNLHKA